MTAQLATADEVRWLDLQSVTDPRGTLTAIETGLHVPFAIARVFYVHRVASGVDRGGHAHRDTDQLAVASSGSLRIDVSDGTVTRTFELDRPDRGLYIPRMLWTRLYGFSPGAVLLVVASTNYDQSRSIRMWEEFLTVRGIA